jgi:cephalosporin hydroxylase
MINVTYDAIDATLIAATDNWSGVRWRGHALWQNPIDLNVTSEHVLAARPDIIVETGTYRGGSAIFFADLMLLSGKRPDVVSIDIAPLATPAHAGVRYLSGRSSTDASVVAEVRALAAGRDVFVVLDSDHGASHVYDELRCYAPLVRPGAHMLVQDGNMYATLGMPLERTPIGGIVRFLEESPEFAVDSAKSPFATTSHPCGWLRRTPTTAG